MMDESNARTFEADVLQLVREFEELKQHTKYLHLENLRLKNDNKQLLEKNDSAKKTIIKIINRLKEVQA